MNDGTPRTRVIPPAAPGDPFWKHLLRERSVARWGNFNWFSARTLLMSLNDQVAKMIESGQPGSIVDRRRMRWVAEQRDRGVRREVPIRLPDTTGMLFLGDPGEMDASQYVLVRDLGLVANGLRGRGVDTALLMSDVVYPAGDINQWADAVYLPYFGLPNDAWADAARKYAEVHPGSTPPPPGPLRDWHVLAMPGNHDWYDGLNGFMFHACGTEPLAEVSYDEAGLTRRQRLAKYSWRSPSAPERERVTPLRDEAARYAPRALHLSREALDMADGVVAYAESVDRTAVAPGAVPSKSLPNLPGPYYAVDLGTHPTRTVEMSAPNGTRYHQAAPVVRVLVVDTGITGTVDPEQADWLADGLATPDLPKVVVTGIPLLVNNTSHPFPVSEPEDQLENPRPRTTVQSIVAAGNSVVATVAGDTHNYQRMVVHGLTGVRAEGVSVAAGSRIPKDTPFPSVQIVAGGAGAYMSRTHNVRYDGANLPLNLSGATEDIVLPGGAHKLFPGRAESVLGYARRLRDGYLLTLEALSIVGLLALAWLVHELVTSYDEVANVFVEPLWIGEEASLDWFTAWAWVTLLVVSVLAAVGSAAARVGAKRPVNTRTILRWLGILALLAVVAVVAFLLDWGLAEGALIVLGLAEVLLLGLAHYLVPLLQSFPRLRRSLGFRLIVAAAVLPIILSNRESAVGLILVGVAVAAAVVAVRGLFRKWRRWAERQMHGPSLVALGFIPFAAVVLVTSIVTLFFPGQILGAAYDLDASTAAAVGLAVRMNSLATLVLVCLAVLVVAFGLPLLKVRRHLPTLVLATAAVLGVALAVVVLWWGLGNGLTWSMWLLGPAGAVLGLLVGAVIVLAVTGGQRIDEPAVEEALVARDAKGSGGKNASVALAMTIAAIPSVDSLSEATQGAFHKNVLTMETHATAASTVLTFRAYGLDDESDPAVGEYVLGENPGSSGFFPIDEVAITYTPG
jgi:hypothetical protein